MDRLPVGKLPLMWAQSLYILGCLMAEVSFGPVLALESPEALGGWQGASPGPLPREAQLSTNQPAGSFPGWQLAEVQSWVAW